MWQILLTSSLTIVGGVVVLVIGQFLTKFVVEPIHRQFALVGEIADALTFYANVYCNPGVGEKKLMDEASTTLRKLASQLKAITLSIRLYSLWAKLRIVPMRSDVALVSSNLIGLSNGIYSSESALANDDRAKDIEKRLKLQW